MLEFPLINDTSRKIIHIDMDAFFAQVEMRDDPKMCIRDRYKVVIPKVMFGIAIISSKKNP